jgi:hypothetical protein
MIPWQVVVALLLIVLTGYYAYEMNKSGGSCGSRYVERFINYSNVNFTYPEGVMDSLAPVSQGPLLEGALKVHTGLSKLDAGSCAAQDRARQMELGGQYVQRTNNYRRDYPDNCSAPLTDFVDSIYAPNNGVGLTVPCDGSC